MHPRAKWHRSVMVVMALIAASCAHQPDAYRSGAGRLRTVEADIALDQAAQGKQLPLHIVSPARGGPYPVVVFSHGGGSSKDMYDELADHWAAAGYVVILPTHADSRSLGFDLQRVPPEQVQQVLDSRRADLVFIVDSLAELARQVPWLDGRIDAERILVGGHSMGGATALTVAGLVLEDVRTGQRFGFRDQRFDALLLLTEPGNSPMMAAEPWRGVPVPVFVVSGSRDYSGQWNGPPKQRFNRIPADHPMPTDVPHHYLYIEGMDHYLGGLVCRTDVPGPPDYDALKAIQAISTAFLDAYLKDDETALGLLDTDDHEAVIGGRASLALR